MTTTVTPAEIAQALIATAGNKSKAAELLGMSIRTFGRRVAEHAEEIETLIAAAQAEQDETTETIEAVAGVDHSDGDVSPEEMDAFLRQPYEADEPAEPASPFVADPANPTEAELAAAIERGLADGTVIDAAEWLAQQDTPADPEPADDDIATERAEARTAAELAEIRSETDPDADGDATEGTEPPAETPAKPAAKPSGRVGGQNTGPAQAAKDAPAYFPAGVVTPVAFRHHLVRQQLAPESLSTQKVYGWLDAKGFPVRFYAENGTVHDTKTAGAKPGITISEGVAWYNAKFAAKAA